MHRNEFLPLRDFQRESVETLDASVETIVRLPKQPFMICIHTVPWTLIHEVWQLHFLLDPNSRPRTINTVGRSRG